MNFQDRYRFWSENSYFDEEIRQELGQVIDPQEIKDRFYTDLEFGTGGLRGIMAAGTNRMNKYVIRKVTQGLAECVCDQGPEGMKRGWLLPMTHGNTHRNSLLKQPWFLPGTELRPISLMRFVLLRSFLLPYGNCMLWQELW